MKLTLLDIAVPLPLSAAKEGAGCDTVTIDRPVSCELPDYRGVMNADALRYEHFLWLMGGLDEHEPAGLPFPWAGLLSIRGTLRPNFGRLVLLLGGNGRKDSSYTELNEIHIALDENAPMGVIRRMYPHLPAGGPVVAVLRNSTIPPQGEQHFLERHRLPLLAAAITTMRSLEESAAPPRHGGARQYQRTTAA
jgi:hypothetical protein